VDTNAIIKFLEQQTDLSETAQVIIFKGYRTTEAANPQEVTVEVLDHGERAKGDRYAVSAISNDGARTGSGEGETVEDAIGTMMVHWPDLG
jgi:hypothetical protein